MARHKMGTHSLSGRIPVKLRSGKKQAILEEQVKNPIQESPLLKAMGIRSFDKEYARLLKKINADDFSGNAASYAMLRAQLAMLVQALPVIEESLHKYKNERAAYALVSISNHAREIAHDLRSFGDQTEMRDRIHNMVLRQIIGSFATRITQDLIVARRELFSDLPPKIASKVEKRLNRLQKQVAEHAQGVDGEGLDALTKILTLK